MLYSIGKESQIHLVADVCALKPQIGGGHRLRD